MYKVRYYFSEVETDNLSEAKEYAFMRLDCVLNIKDKVTYGNERLFTGFEISQKEYESYLRRNKK